ncbi:helix-turn-helix domain-containing protein [Paracoccus denitrificans]|uniref:helix-turn-helix domain-containing protein n=1 Tax=Paracoccus denitrificans TaxID=266 RepID=UPI000CEC5763|nr:helix-turn-helix transcriptional regulator [Paracoccus denitrificans]
MDLTEHIKAHGLSRAQICEAAGISRGMLSLIERGKRRIGTERALAFANALGLSIDAVRPDLADLFNPPTSEDAA